MRSYCWFIPLCPSDCLFPTNNDSCNSWTLSDWVINVSTLQGIDDHYSGDLFPVLNSAELTTEITSAAYILQKTKRKCSSLINRNINNIKNQKQQMGPPTNLLFLSLCPIINVVFQQVNILSCNWWTETVSEDYKDVKSTHLACVYNYSLLFSGSGENRKSWVLAEITDKEYCQAKKVRYVFFTNWKSIEFFA